VFVALTQLFLGFPLAVIVILSFNGAPDLAFPPKSFALDWYLSVFRSESLAVGFWQSLMIASIATATAVLVSIPASYAMARRRFLGRQLVINLAMAPLIVPEVVIGLGTLSWLIALKLNVPPYSLFYLHTILLLPYALRLMVASLEGSSGHLEEAAIMLGAGPLRAFLLVILPQMVRAIGAAALFCFICSFHNLTATIFLVKSKPTLSLAIFGYITTRNDPTIAALSTLLMAVSSMLVLVGDRFFGFVRELGHE
jgi:putative spermidine/putrescine transport system permease protein